MSDVSGKQILRLIIPDKENRMPDQAEYPYSMQMLCTKLLTFWDTGRV